MKTRIFNGLILGAALMFGFGISAVHADKYPTKPITMIIPLGAGGSHDLNARVFTSVIPKYLGNAIIVKLMPGASGQKGTAAAARAKVKLAGKPNQSVRAPCRAGPTLLTGPTSVSSERFLTPVEADEILTA